MRVLIACECSGRVRDAFLARGHDAVSADLKPSEVPGPHIIGDVSALLREPWDLVIAHPPCTYLTAACPGNATDPERLALRAKALEFFLECYNANAPRVVCENPVGHVSKLFRPPDQTIHPYYFGERALKRTCLWLRGVRPLIWRRTDELFGPATFTPPPEPKFGTTLNARGKPRRYYALDLLPSGRNRSTERSRTFRAIAEALADQYGGACV